MLLNRPALILVCVALLALPHDLAAHRFDPQKHRSREEAEKIDLHFVGEVARDKIFQQDIGHDLVFRLTPSPDIGWKIEIAPKSDPDDGPVEFSAVATPPYRMYNPRYLEASYGTSAKEAVGITPRVFYFVESVNDEHRAEECLNAAMYPTNASDEEKVRVVAEQTQIKIGKGELRILKSRIGHGKTANDPSTIDWLRFDVYLEFSPGLTMANILARVAHPQ